MQKTSLKITAFLLLITSFLLILLVLYTGCELYTASPPKNKNSGKKSNEDSNSSSSSSSTWTTQLLGASGVNTEAYGITSDPSGNIYATGCTYGDLDGQTKKGICDLFAVKYDMNGNKLWTKLLGSDGVFTFTKGITSDISGNIYTTGIAIGDLDGQTSTGASDLFIVKYDTNGEKQWIKLLGVSEAYTRALGITSDSNGNIYVTGYTDGDLDGENLTGSEDVFVVKYNPNGNKLWTRLIGAPGEYTKAYSITSDLSGNIYTTGYTSGDLDGHTKTGTCDLFVVKYNANGNKLWIELLGVSGAGTYANSITLDPNGNIYVTGYTQGDLDTQTLTGYNDLFVVKYDANGNKLWTRLIGAPDECTIAYSITSDSSGNVYITGYTDGNLDTQTLTGYNDLFIVKYDANGNKLWTRLIGAPGEFTIAYSITSDLNRNIYTTGRTSGDLDGQTKTGKNDAFIVKYNANGDKQ